MHRRRFLKYALISPLIANTARSRDSNKPLERQRRARFWIAGVKHQNLAVDRLTAGEPLELSAQRFRGQLCYEVRDTRGTRLGYVPRSLITLISQSRVVSVSVSRVKPYAVPWRQIEADMRYAPRPNPQA